MMRRTLPVADHRTPGGALYTTPASARLHFMDSLIGRFPGGSFRLNDAYGAQSHYVVWLT